MKEVDRVIDVDTFKVDGESHRLASVQGAELKKGMERLNPFPGPGEQAKKFTEAVLPKGSSVSTKTDTFGVYGRPVGPVDRDVNGVKIDMSLVTLDQDFSEYFVRHGKQADPTRHKQYKEYYSKYAPYNYGDVQERLTPDEMEEMGIKQELFRETLQKFNDGDATQTELDVALVDLYGDPQKVVNYRHQLNNWDRKVDMQDRDGTMRFAHDYVMSNPEARRRYNIAVANSHLSLNRAPEEKKSMWERAKFSYQIMGDLSNIADKQDMYNMRVHGSAAEIPDSELLKELPPQYHETLLAEAAKYNDDSAMMLKEQLLTDIHDNREFDKMEWYAQIGYGTMATLASPSTVMGGGVLGTAAKTVNTGIRSWKTSKALKSASQAATWAAVGGLETMHANNPRLDGDHTFTSRDYYMDAIFGAGLGGIFGLSAQGVTASKNFFQARKKEQAELNQAIENEVNPPEPVDDPRMDEPLQIEGELIPYDRPANEIPQTPEEIRKYNREVEEMRKADEWMENAEIEPSQYELPPGEIDPKYLGNEDTLLEEEIKKTADWYIEKSAQKRKQVGTVRKAETQSIASEQVQKRTALDYKQWEVIREVDQEGFKLASETIAHTYKPKSGMWYLMDKHSSLNNANLPKETREVVNKLNSDILHLAGAFPTGKVPKNVDKAVKDVMFTQVTTEHNNAIELLVKGEVANPAELLHKYINNIEKQAIWSGEGAPEGRMTMKEFIQRHPYLFGPVAQPSDLESLLRLSNVIPKEHSWFKDVLMMNEDALQRGDTEYIRAVEKLNMLVTDRFMQREGGALKEYTDSRTSWGQSVEMSPDEIRKTLKEEGLEPRTAEYSARLKELRLSGRKKVSAEMNQIGKKNLFEVGEMRESIDPDSTMEVDTEVKSRLAKGGFTPGDDFTKEVAKDMVDKVEAKNLGEVTPLERDALEQDILPRSFNEVVTHEAYKTPTVEALNHLRENLNTRILKKLGVYEIKGKTEAAAQVKRLDGVTRALATRKTELFERMVASNDVGSVVDVIRVAQTIKDKKASIPKESVKAEPSGRMKPGKLAEPLDIPKAEGMLPKRTEISQAAKRKLDTLNDTLRSTQQRLRELVDAERYERYWADKEFRRNKRTATPSETFKKDAAAKEQVRTVDKLKSDIKELQEERIRAEKAYTTATKQETDLKQGIKDAKVEEKRKAEEKKQKEEADKPIDLKEEDLEHLDNSLPASVNKTPKTPEEVAKIKETTEEVIVEQAKDEAKRVGTELANWVRKGLQVAYREARKPSGVLDYVGRIATTFTKDISTKLEDSKLTSVQYFGANVTENGRGYAGAIRRPPTGGLIRHGHWLELQGMSMPQYKDAVGLYAVDKGKGEVGKLNARTMAGQDSKLVDAFNKEVFTLQELRRQGRDTKGISQRVIDFVEHLDATYSKGFDKQIDANIKGFTKDRRVKNYIPHIWLPANLEGAINTHGLAKVERLFEKAYLSSINNKLNPTNPEAAKDLAKRHIEYIRGKVASGEVDQFGPAIDSRAKHRMDLDTLTEVDGLSILDLLNTEVRDITTKYNNRVAGWAGLSESTNGLLNSQFAIDAFRENVKMEGVEKGIDTAKQLQWVDDVVNMMLGRPTREGLPHELRDLKDLTVLTRMGGLGTSQAIETGQVATRTALNLFSDPKTVKRVFDIASEDINDKGVMSEILSISGISDDIEWFDSQAVHLDQAEMNKISKVRNLTKGIADLGTFGAYKAPASRLLGKVTGFNAIRKMQHRLVQAQFTTDIANHFRSGTGKMGNARMADVGLTDPNGVDSELENVFKNIVEWDGDRLVKLNVDKWPKTARNKFHYAMLRDAAQQVQMTHVGELPPWMNRPMMALLFQFRTMPLVAQNKQLGRSMAFADKEAVANVMLNTAMAGLVRYSKFAVLGAGVSAITGQEWKEPGEKQMQIHKYIQQFGMYGDYYDLVLGMHDAELGNTTPDTIWDTIGGEVPVLGLMDDYRKAAQGAYTNDADKLIDGASGLLPLGNTAAGDMLAKWADKHFGQGEIILTDDNRRN